MSGASWSCWEAARNIEDVVDEYPIAVCPKCAAVQTDYDGFGFAYCPECGYCTHPSADGGVCNICDEAV